MSTLAYAALTTKRLAATPKTSSTSSPPGTKPYIDAMAAIVPAEVLAAHAVIVGFLSTATTDSAGKQVTRLTHPNYLKFAFFFLIVASAALYVIGRASSQQKLRSMDWARAAIPPVAFFAWTALQPTTLLDAVAPDFQVPGRTTVGILIALVLGPLAILAGYKADAAGPKPKTG